MLSSTLHALNLSPQNELGVLEFIHCFVEVLDKHFGQVCELDIMNEMGDGQSSRGRAKYPPIHASSHAFSRTQAHSCMCGIQARSHARRPARLTTQLLNDCPRH